MNGVKFVLVVLSLALASQGIGDQITLKNGDSITGSLQSVAGNTVTVQTKYAGVMFIGKDQVESIVTDNEFVVVDQVGERRTVRLDESTSLAEIAIVRVADNVVSQIASAWNKQVTFALAGTSGNAETQHYSINGQSDLVRPDVEHLLRFSYLRETAARETRKHSLDVKYGIHWRRQQRWFNTANVDYFRDPFKEVSWRALIGMGGGAKLRDFGHEKLALEIAASGVYETLDAFRELSPAVRLGSQYSRLLSGGRIEIYQNNRFLWITQKENGVLDSENGVRLTLSAQFKFDMRATIQYETAPATGVKNTDVTYSLGLGVVF